MEKGQKAEKKPVFLITVLRRAIKKSLTENITRIYRKSNRKRNNSKTPLF